MPAVGAESNELVDSSPQSTAVSSVAVTSQTAESPGDGYGTITATADTEFVRIIPPKANRYSRADGFTYNCSTTAHTVTFMVTLDQTEVTTDAAAGSATIKVNRLPSSLDSGNAAASDFIVTKNENGTFVAYKIASISGNTITVTTSIGDADGSGLVTKVEAESPVYFMGAPGDHTKRRFTMIASTNNIMMPPKGFVAMSTMKNTPILVHSNNATAAGSLTGPFYTHPRA